MDIKQAATISSRYIRFADEEARGRSPLYEKLARGVAKNSGVTDFLSALPPEKQQPNLLFAAVRHLFGTPADWTEFRERLLASPDAVRAVMLSHSTQTNEPARCATLLPILMTLPQPLALIEVGASAGLCLLPDRYGYDYGSGPISPNDGKPGFPIFTCSANETTPVPATLPQIVWRAGLDLNPLNVSNPEHAAWLTNLVWPEHTERLRNLRAAIKIAAAIDVPVMKGSLLGDDLARLCDAAPKNATLVIFHTAVLAYIADRSDREAFARQAMKLCHYWISNEGPRVFPDIAHRAAGQGAPGSFLLSVNGSPVAWTHPHGASIEWFRAA